MNILTTRLGLIQACETDVITIPAGLLGFRSFTQYILVPDPVGSNLMSQSAVALSRAANLMYDV